MMKMRRKLQFQKRQNQEQQELQQLPSDQDSPHMQFSEFMNTKFAWISFIFFFAEYVSEIVLLAVIVIIKKLTQRLPDPEQVVNQIVNCPQEQRRLRPRENLRRPNRYQN